MNIEIAATFVASLFLLLTWLTGRAISRANANSIDQNYSASEMTLHRLTLRYFALVAGYGFFILNLAPNWDSGTHWYILCGSFLLLWASSWWPTKPLTPPKAPLPEQKETSRAGAWSRKTFGTWQEPLVAPPDEHATHFLSQPSNKE